MSVKITFEYRAAYGIGPSDSTKDVEWPCVPREGEHVEIDGETGLSGEVRSVLWRDDGSAIVRLR